MGEPLARIEVARDGDRVIASISGDIDLSNADDVERTLTATFTPGTGSVPVLDLRAVTYIDSQGLRVLHELASRLASSDVTMQVVAPPASVAGDVIRLTAIDRSMQLVDDPEGSEPA